VKKIVYLDMDGCLCNYKKSYIQYKKDYPDIPYPQSIPGLFISLQPIEGAIETAEWLIDHELFDTYILSAPSIMNHNSYSEKALWVRKHLGLRFLKRLILSQHKNLNKGDYLVDDYVSGKGQEAFEGEIVHFGSEQFLSWNEVKAYFSNIASNIAANK
jgi:5'(3')-deoxyribonucleotidase